MPDSLNRVVPSLVITGGPDGPVTLATFLPAEALVAIQHEKSPGGRGRKGRPSRRGGIGSTPARDPVEVAQPPEGPLGEGRQASRVVRPAAMDLD